MTATVTRTIEAQTNDAKLCLRAGIALSFVNVIAVIAIAMWHPPDAQKLTDDIYKIMSPTITALIAFGIHGSLTALDGLKTELVEAVGEKEHAKGVVEGLVVNPKTNIAPADVLSINGLDRRKPSEPKD